MAAGVGKFTQDKNRATILITHYRRMLEFIKPTRVHVLTDGRVTATGGWEIVEQLERDGYEPFLAMAGGVSK